MMKIEAIFKKLRQQSSEERANKFLSELKGQLLSVASAGQYYHAVLQLKYSKGHENHLDQYEKLIFDGCKEMGLDTKIEELFLIGDSIGRHIFVRWEKVDVEKTTP